MNSSLVKQVIVMAVLATVLAVLNNFRPNAKIKWVRDWQDFSELANKEVMDDPVAPVIESSPEEELDEATLMAQLTDQIAGNFQVTDIGIDTAKRFHQYAKDFTLWIDARSPDLFEQGHVEGAMLCYINDKNTYLPDIEAKIAELQPLSLIIYCKGADCTDSHHLAEDLFGMGYENIFVYKDGYGKWLEAGLPVGGADANATAVENGEAVVTSSATEEKPPGMYLEHVLRDMIPFVLGLGFLVFWKRSRQSQALTYTAGLIVGLFFIWAAFPKILQPFAFAKSIWNYDILPGALINISALGMPMLELVAGLGLVFWLFRKGGGAITAGLLILFVVAVGFNMLRGHEFNCGCTSDKVYLTSVYLEGWNDKITLILRDLGLLVMSLLAVLHPKN